MLIHLCYFTKIHTLVSKKVSSQTCLEIVVKYVSWFFNYWRWPSCNEIGYLLFYKFSFDQSFNYSQHCKKNFCLSLMFFLICYVVFLSVAFCCRILFVAESSNTLLMLQPGVENNQQYNCYTIKDIKGLGFIDQEETMDTLLWSGLLEP